MPPKKRRQGNNKENIPNLKLDPFSIQTIIVRTLFLIHYHDNRLIFLGEKYRRI